MRFIHGLIRCDTSGISTTFLPPANVVCLLQINTDLKTMEWEPPRTPRFQNMPGDPLASPLSVLVSYWISSDGWSVMGYRVSCGLLAC